MSSDRDFDAGTSSACNGISPIMGVVSADPGVSEELYRALLGIDWRDWDIGIARHVGVSCEDCRHVNARRDEMEPYWADNAGRNKRLTLLIS